MVKAFNSPRSASPRRPVMNAFFKATGKRLRDVPLKNQGIELV